MQSILKALGLSVVCVAILLPVLASTAENRQPASGAVNKMSFEFSLSGEGGGHSVFSAARLSSAHVLRIRLRAAPSKSADSSNEASNEEAATSKELPYGCARFTLSLGDKRIESTLLTAESGARGCAAHEQSIDLTAELKRAGRGTAATAPIALTVAEAETDAFCRALSSHRLLGSPETYCPSFPAQPTQAVRGVIEIETDGALE